MHWEGTSLRRPDQEKAQKRVSAWALGLSGDFDCPGHLPILWERFSRGFDHPSKAAVVERTYEDSFHLARGNWPKEMNMSCYGCTLEFQAYGLVLSHNS